MFASISFARTRASSFSFSSRFPVLLMLFRLMRRAPYKTLVCKSALGGS